MATLAKFVLHSMKNMTEGIGRTRDYSAFEKALLSVMSCAPCATTSRPHGAIFNVLLFIIYLLCFIHYEVSQQC